MTDTYSDTQDTNGNFMRVRPSDFDGRDGKSLGSKPGTFDDGSRWETKEKKKGLIHEMKM